MDTSISSTDNSFGLLKRVSIENDKDNNSFVNSSQLQSRQSPSPVWLPSSHSHHTISQVNPNVPSTLQSKDLYRFTDISQYNDVLTKANVTKPADFHTFTTTITTDTTSSSSSLSATDNKTVVKNGICNSCDPLLVGMNDGVVVVGSNGDDDGVIVNNNHDSTEIRWRPNGHANQEKSKNFHRLETNSNNGRRHFYNNNNNNTTFFTHLNRQNITTTTTVANTTTSTNNNINNISSSSISSSSSSINSMSSSNNLYPRPTSPSDTTLISNAILLIVILFLACFVVAYFIFQNHHIATAKKHLELEKFLCGTNNMEMSSTNCLTERDWKDVVDSVERLSDILHQSSNAAICPDQQENLSNSLTNWLEFKSRLNFNLSNELWDSIARILLFMGQKHFFIGLYHIHHQSLLTSNNVISDIGFVKSLKSETSIRCWLKQIPQDIFYSPWWSLICIICLLGVCGICAYKLWAWIKHRKKTMRQNVQEAIMLVTQRVHEKYLTASQRSLSVNYVVPEQLRHDVALSVPSVNNNDIWEKVYSKVHNECNIAVKHIPEIGEVWKWRGGIGWQGSALPPQQASDSIHIEQRAPCLKIRNMFMKKLDDDGRRRIINELLVRCEGLGNIFHVATEADNNEGFVYIKCENCDVATKVFDKVHAHYFDGQLVTVLFLTLDKYYQRFPEAEKESNPICFMKRC